jgi:hypothetical protein
MFEFRIPVEGQQRQAVTAGKIKCKLALSYNFDIIINAMLLQVYIVGLKTSAILSQITIR